MHFKLCKCVNTNHSGDSCQPDSMFVRDPGIAQCGYRSSVLVCLLLSSQMSLHQTKYI